MNKATPMSGNALQGPTTKDNSAVQRKRMGQGSKEQRQVRPKLCKHQDCTNGAKSRGLCTKHGGGKRCQHSDCENGAQHPTEFCIKHGGGKRCQHKGCKTSAESPTDFCIKHGGGKRCQHVDCENGALHPTAFCGKHGGGKRCQHIGCKTGAVSRGLCTKHGGGKRCQHSDCENGALSRGLCSKHGGGKRCQHKDCENGAVSAADFCSKHGGGKRCQHKDCTNGAVSPAEFCTQHGGGKRCETLAHLPNDVPPPAYYAVGGAHMCWGCFVALFPDKAKLKVRKEQYVLAELERLVPELGAYETTWDCAVPGGCSLKQPDKLYKLSDRYLHLEVDEFGHADKACVDEDTRLELIAADVGLPGLVLRLDPDNPPCFRHRQLGNGERVYERIQSPFNSLLAQAAEKVRSFLADLPPTNVERVFLRSTPGVLATRPTILTEAGDRKRLRQRRRTPEQQIRQEHGHQV